MSGTQSPVEIRGLSADGAVHLLRAVRLWRKTVREQGGSLPADFASIEPMLMSGGVTWGQGGSNLAEPLHDAQAGSMPNVSPLLTYEQVAQTLGCSMSTVKRRVRAGALPVVRDGGITRVRAVDLDAYIEQGA